MLTNPQRSANSVVPFVSWSFTESFTSWFCFFGPWVIVFCFCIFFFISLVYHYLLSTEQRRSVPPTVDAWSIYDGTVSSQVHKKSLVLAVKVTFQQKIFFFFILFSIFPSHQIHGSATLLSPWSHGGEVQEVLQKLLVVVVTVNKLFHALLRDWHSYTPESTAMQLCFINKIYYFSLSASNRCFFSFTSNVLQDCSGPCCVY